LERLVAIDVDGVIAYLLGRWLDLYNADFDDNLTPYNIGWHFHKQAKGGREVYKYLSRKDLYDEVQEIPGAKWAVENLRDRGFRVVFVTSCVRDMEGPKREWMFEHGFLEKAHSPKDWVVMSDKGLLDAPVLVDDAEHNVVRFDESRADNGVLTL
jgi:5'(3')-deoxyribonucleotidase